MAFRLDFHLELSHLFTRSIILLSLFSLAYDLLIFTLVQQMSIASLLIFLFCIETLHNILILASKGTIQGLFKDKSMIFYSVIVIASIIHSLYIVHCSFNSANRTIRMAGTRPYCIVLVRQNRK